MENKIKEEQDLKIRNMVEIPIVRGGNRYKGKFISFSSNSDSNVEEHFAVGLGDWENVAIPTVRLHSECLTGDVFSSERCDCGNQLTESVKLASERGGFILYLRQEGRGIGLFNKLDAYKLQDEGHDTYAANNILGFGNDMRNFKIASRMLKALGHNKIYLHTNNNEKTRQLQNAGIEVVEIVNTKLYLNETNKDYLNAKKEIGGHNLNI